MLVFPHEKNVYTVQTLSLAFERAQPESLPIICASTYGDTALAMMDKAKQVGYDGKLIAVRGIMTFNENHKIVEQPMPPDVYARLTEGGVQVVTATYAFAGFDRAISHRFGGMYPAELAANVLRLFSQGMKVAVEIALMAFDAGHISYPQRVVSIGGTSRGANTAIVMTPCPVSRFFEANIHEVLCMPE